MNREEGQRSHQPKGGMCTSCAKWREDCSSLSFEAMPVILTMPSGVHVVRCTEHVRSNAEVIERSAAGAESDRLPGSAAD